MFKISSIVDKERDIMKKNKLFLLLPVLLVACNEISTPSISTPISTSYSSSKTTISVSITDDTSSTSSDTSSNTSESITSDSGDSFSTSSNEELGNSLSTTEEESSTSTSNNSTGIEDVNSSTTEDTNSGSNEEDSSNSNDDNNKPSEEIEFYSLIGYVIEYVSSKEGTYLKGQEVGLYRIEQDETSGEITESYVATSTTDEDGKYVFDNISKGEYVILLAGILPSDQWTPSISELKVSVGGEIVKLLKFLIH